MEATDVCDWRCHEFTRGDERSIPWRRRHDCVTRRWKDRVEFFITKVTVMLILHHEAWRIHDDGDHWRVLASGSWCLVPTRALWCVGDVSRRCVPARAPLFGCRRLKSLLRPFPTRFLLLGRF